MKLTVCYHRDAESWWADSPSVPGFYAAAEDFSELVALVRDGLAFHFDVDEDRIEIFEQFEDPRTYLEAGV